MQHNQDNAEQMYTIRNGNDAEYFTISKLHIHHPAQLSLHLVLMTKQASGTPTS